MYVCMYVSTYQVAPSDSAPRKMDDVWTGKHFFIEFLSHS